MRAAPRPPSTPSPPPTPTSTPAPSPPLVSSALLLLADGRFPAGAHAHSGGLEAAAALQGVQDVPGLEAFLRGRLATTGAVNAAFAAASCATLHTSGVTSRATSRATAPPAAVGPLLRGLHDELQARTPSSALRTASQRLGRQLLRTARQVWPHPALDELAAALPSGAHQPVTLGAVAAAAGLEPHSAALAAAHDAVTGPATAAVRLLGLDPFAVHAALARLAGQLDATAAAGAAHAHTLPAELPSWATPLLDITTEHHATWEVRLFAS